MLVLASSSPRRRELLEKWGYSFSLVRPDVEERWPEGAGPEEGVCRLAEQKASVGWRLWREQGGKSEDVVLGADTIVVLADEIMGKPVDKEDAERMLRTMRGRPHQVITGVTLAVAGKEGAPVLFSDRETTTVTFRNLREKTIKEYVATGEPMDKAAAYAIQGKAEAFVAHVDGSYTNVVGLPMELVRQRLREKGIEPVFPQAQYGRRIKDLPPGLKPRERMHRVGEEALSDRELLAILLRTGTHRESALDLAERILVQTKGLHGLAKQSVRELEQVKGIGQAKAAQVKAALELGKRCAAVSGGEKTTIRSPEDAASLLMEEMRRLDKEHFRVLMLDTKNHVVDVVQISVGSLNLSVVHPRECFKEALKCSAHALILVHNHPSGDASPSRQDVEITKRLVESGRLLGIEVLDHIVIGDKAFVSLKEQGYME